MPAKTKPKTAAPAAPPASLPSRDLPAAKVKISDVRPHPRNYKTHPDDQLLHIQESLKQFGFYRNVVLAKDGTILAGHGVVEAARRLGMEEIPAVRLDLDAASPSALKLLALDNEVGKFAETDDRALTEILKEIGKGDPTALLGTGYDQNMLAALAMISRPAAELKNFSAAAEWVGMPGYQDGEDQYRLVVTFTKTSDREEFVKRHGLRIDKVVGVGSWSTRWPWTDREDKASLRFEAP